MKLTKMKELREEQAATAAKVSEIFAEAGEDMDMSKVKVISGTSEEKVAKLRELNEEMSDRKSELDPLEAEYAELERTKRLAEEVDPALTGAPVPEPGKGREGKIDQKSLGELFIESKAGGERKGDEVMIEEVELKTLMQTSEGWTPEATRSGRFVEKATRPIQLIDLIPGGTTTQNAVVYMEETVFTNNAAETAEGGGYKEVALKVEEKSSPVKKITAWLPITDEQLEDVPQAQGYVNNRLPFMVYQRLDGQIVVGSGEGDNLLGFLNKEGLNTQEKGTDPVPDAILKGATKSRVTGRAHPSAVVFHPVDWQDVRLLRTADGIYIWGNPSEIGPERIWGIDVVQSDAITEGTALVGDFAMHSELATRRGMEVKVADQHASFFTDGKQAVRASVRVALVILRPAAFTKVTGI